MWWLISSALAAELTGVEALYAWGWATCAVRTAGDDLCWTGRGRATPRRPGTGGAVEPPFASRRLLGVGDGWCAIGEDGRQACIGQDWRMPVGAAPGTPTDRWVDVDAEVLADRIPPPGPRVRRLHGDCERLSGGRVGCAEARHGLVVDGDLRLTRVEPPPAPRDREEPCTLVGRVVRCGFVGPTESPVVMEDIDAVVQGRRLVCGRRADTVRCRGEAPDDRVFWPDQVLDGVREVAVAPQDGRVFALRDDGSIWRLDRTWVSWSAVPGAERLQVDGDLVCAWGAGVATCRDDQGRTATFPADAPGAPRGGRITLGGVTIRPAEGADAALHLVEVGP